MIAGGVCSALADVFRACHITATQESPIQLNALFGESQSVGHGDQVSGPVIVFEEPKSGVGRSVTGVIRMRTCGLIIVTFSDTLRDSLAHEGRLSRGHFRKAERDAVPARG